MLTINSPTPTFNDPVKAMLPETLNDPVISVFETIDTVVPLSYIFESCKWSSPCATGTLYWVNPNSCPIEPVFLGPFINIAEL